MSEIRFRKRHWEIFLIISENVCKGTSVGRKIVRRTSSLLSKALNYNLKMDFQINIL